MSLWTSSEEDGADFLRVLGLLDVLVNGSYPDSKHLRAGHSGYRWHLKPDLDRSYGSLTGNKQQELFQGFGCKKVCLLAEWICDKYLIAQSQEGKRL